MSTPRIPNRLDGAQRIAEEIGAAIVAGRYAPDTLVPGEIELGRRYGASRTVVREALKLLSAKGLIASRKRSGTRARPREAWNMLDADVLAWRLRDGRAEPKFVSDLLHVRAVVEPAAAAMAARRHCRGRGLDHRAHVQQVRHELRLRPSIAQPPSENVGVQHVPRLARPRPCAAALARGDQALGREELQRFPHDRARGTIAAAERDLAGHQFVGRIATGDDRRTDLFGDTLGAIEAMGSARR